MPGSNSRWNSQIEHYTPQTQPPVDSSPTPTSLPWNNPSPTSEVLPTSSAASRMATGPPNVSHAAYPSLSAFGQLPTDAKSPLPRLMAPPCQSDFFMRPPVGLVTTAASNGMRDPPALLSGMFPPLGFMGPLAGQFDPSAAAAAAMAAVTSGKLSPGTCPTTSGYSSSDFSGAAAAAAAAMQAASLKLTSSRPQRPMPPMPYEKMMPSMFFPRPDHPGVPPPPPLGVRPQVTPQSACEGLFPSPVASSCASSPYGGASAAKLASPVLPHAANRPALTLASKIPECNEK